jgi:predicted kinase
MQIVIIGGLPCSGKSTLAEQLRLQWRQPLLSKDVFKESLFDSLGSGDRAWSRRISGAAYSLMFRQAEELAGCGLSFAIEGNFRDGEHRREFELLAELGGRLVQVHCHAAPDTLVSRFSQRARTQSRHRGHADQESWQEIVAELSTSLQQPLSVAADLIDCDTTDNGSAAIEDSIEQLLAILKRT